MEDTDRCGRGGADGGRAVVSAGRLAVRLRGRVQGHGVLGDPALPGVVLCRQRVRCRELRGYAILWGRRVLGGGVRLGHGVRGVGGLLVTLPTGRRQRSDQCWKLVVAASRSGNGRHIASPLRLEQPLIIANEHSLGRRARLRGGGGDTRGAISTALVGKRERRDQLIDQTLIRAFDFNGRSVRSAAHLFDEPLPR